jgi:hypothetical protein
MADHDLDKLRARAGDLAALTALGKKLLVGEGVPQNTEEGIALVRDAASRGEPQANVLLSVLAAWGVLQPRNIDAALDHLARAAQLGSTPAQRELQLLARDSSSDWPSLRRRITVASWTKPPPVHVVIERPLIAVIEHFASPEECAWLIERGRPHLRRAKVYHGSAELDTSEVRTNREADFTVFNADVLLSLLRDRMSAAAGAPVTHFEITKLLHYQPGEEFGLHADFLELKTPELVREVQRRGQRAGTFLVYLNEGYEGGETNFPRLGFRYKGATGGALLFSNVDATGAPDYATLHAGLPPTKGEKWLLSQWIRTRPVTG